MVTALQGTPGGERREEGGEGKGREFNFSFDWF